MEKNVFKASNRTYYYTIERVKKGYISDYTTIYQNGVNPMLAIDGSIFLVGLIMTAVFVVGLILRPRRRSAGLGPDSWLVTALYLFGLWGLVVISQ